MSDGRRMASEVGMTWCVPAGCWICAVGAAGAWIGVNSGRFSELRTSQFFVAVFGSFLANFEDVEVLADQNKSPLTADRLITFKIRQIDKIFRRCHHGISNALSTGQAAQWQVKIILGSSLQIRNSMPSPSAPEVACRRVNN